MTPEQKAWIDAATYEQLLRKWRFSPMGDPMFQGDSGDYYQERMTQLKAADPDGAIQASKNIGWK